MPTRTAQHPSLRSAGEPAPAFPRADQSADGALEPHPLGDERRSTHADYSRTYQFGDTEEMQQVVDALDAIGCSVAVGLHRDQGRAVGLVLHAWKPAASPAASGRDW